MSSKDKLCRYITSVVLNPLTRQCNKYILVLSCTGLFVNDTKFVRLSLNQLFEKRGKMSLQVLENYWMSSNAWKFQIFLKYINKLYTWTISIHVIFLLDQLLKMFKAVDS